MPKISELPVLAEAAADDIVPLVDTSGSVTSKVTRSGLVTGGFPLIATAGTAAAFTLALPTSLTNAAGQTFRVRFHLAPDAAATIAIDGQTALALRLYDGAGALTALVAGDVAIDSVVEVTLIDDGGTLRAVVNRDRTLAVSSLPDCIFTGPNSTGSPVLDTTVRNVGGFASLASNTVTLAAGTYIISVDTHLRLNSGLGGNANASISIRSGATDLIASGARSATLGATGPVHLETIITPGVSSDYNVNLQRDDTNWQVGTNQLGSGHSGTDVDITTFKVWRLA